MAFRCTFCNSGAKISAAEIREHGKPTPGSFAVCHNCGVVSLYGEGDTVRAATEEDLQVLDHFDQVMIRMIRLVALERQQTPGN